MITEGRLSIDLDVADGRVRRVNVASTRPVHAARSLAGRPYADVQRLVPLLFPVCGAAHGVAFARALRAARALPADASTIAGETVLTLAEAVVSHVFQLAIVWREAAGHEPDTAIVKATRAHLADVQRSIGTARARAAAESLADAAEPLLRRDAPFVERVEREARADFGAVDGTDDDHLDVAAIGAALARDPAFAERPTTPDGPRVTGTGGLAARLRARQAQAVRHLEALRAHAQDLRDASSGAEHGRTEGEGVGSAETARGPLVHWLRLEGGTIADLRVVAPTDWTFHPDGHLRRALEGIHATATLARDARWLVVALDPCIPFGVEVRHA